MYNFEMGKNRILSYTTTFSAISTSGATVSLEPVGSISHIVYITFSIVVVTLNTNDFELGSVSLTGQSASSQNLYMNYTVTKFTLSSGLPHIQFFYEWITGSMGYSSTYTSYRSQLWETVYASANKIEIRSASLTNIYLTGVKVNILLVTKNSAANNYSPDVYSVQTTDGFNSATYPDTFIRNFGIDASKYGTEASGYCLHGI